MEVPETINDEELLKNPMWKTEQGKPIREAIQYLEYGKDNYWTGDKMVDHTILVAEPIFRYAFPNCQALFAFDNASNHCYFAKDILVAEKMNRNPGSTQPKICDSFIYSKGRPQAMVFPDNHPIITLRGKAKGLEQVLRELELWKNYRSDGFPFLLKCSTTDRCKGCQPIDGGCCGKNVLANERDFCNQKGRLEEEIQARGQKVIFYSKFHYKLNFIERFWCSAKWFACENCKYNFEALQNILSKALHSVTKSMINRYYLHCHKILEMYIDGYKYETKSFKDTIYRSHRQVIDKSKW